MEWLREYSVKAAETDQLKGRSDHLALLAAGLFGEAGSVAAEAKKIQREGPAYPAYRKRLIEELGDFLWYFVRFADASGIDAVRDLDFHIAETRPGGLVERALELGTAASLVLSVSSTSSPRRDQLLDMWKALMGVAREADIQLQDAADRNLTKVRSRWPVDRNPHPLFDDGDPIEDQLPRVLAVDFLERGSSGGETVLLRYHGIGIGDRITDNIADPDGYRYHDVFHMAYVAFMGWSPVVRSLLRCKRKRDPSVDRDQDGARAVIVEEAVSAIVFSRAKQMDFFAGAEQVDYDLLKIIQEHVSGYEVDGVPLWQWEEAILAGYRVFRLLREHAGGRVSWDMGRRELLWASTSGSEAR